MIRRVVAIDVGFRNLGYCALQRNGDAGIVVDACNVTAIVPPQLKKPGRVELHSAMYQWAIEHKEMLAAAHVIVLENQMKAKFQNLNTVIMTLYPQTFMRVHPFALCARYQLPRKRADKKLATIAKVRELMPMALEGATDKIDDMADAALMAHYALSAIE